MTRRTPPDATILPPDTRLKDKVGDCDPDTAQSFVASGDDALSASADNVSVVAAELIQTLRAAMSSPRDPEALADAAHDLRCIAANAGQAGAGAAADSLWRYLDGAEDANTDDPRIARLHVDAISALFSARASVEDAATILEALAQASTRALASGKNQG